MKLLIYDDDCEEWVYKKVSFWSLLKFYIWLDIARGIFIVIIFLVIGVFLTMLGY